MAIADYAGVKVAEIRKELVETYGLDESEVKAIKGKLELVKMIEEQKTLAAIDDIDFGDESSDGDFEASNDEVVDELLEESEEVHSSPAPSICAASNNSFGRLSR